GQVRQLQARRVCGDAGDVLNRVLRDVIRREYRERERRGLGRGLTGFGRGDSDLLKPCGLLLCRVYGPGPAGPETKRRYYEPAHIPCRVHAALPETCAFPRQYNLR